MIYFRWNPEPAIRPEICNGLYELINTEELFCIVFYYMNAKFCGFWLFSHNEVKRQFYRFFGVPFFGGKMVSWFNCSFWWLIHKGKPNSFKPNSTGRSDDIHIWNSFSTRSALTFAQEFGSIPCFMDFYSQWIQFTEYEKKKQKTVNMSTISGRNLLLPSLKRSKSIARNIRDQLLAAYTLIW